MDSLLAGTLILPWRVHCAGMMSSAARACGNHSGPSRKPFRDRAKTVRLPAGITVRLQPGIRTQRRADVRGTDTPPEHQENDVQPAKLDVHADPRESGS